MTTKVVSSSKPVLDFSKYARPELVTAVSRVADFFGDAIQSVVIPPACLVIATLLLSYFLPFSSTLATILFLIIGISGSIITGLSYGALKFIHMTARDLKFIITETLYLVHNVISDISGYIHNPAAFPPLSDVVHGVLSTVIKPVILGVFEKKFYGSVLKYVADPMLSGVDKWLTSIVGSMERRFAHVSPSKGKAAISSDDHQHDKKSRHEYTATENLYHTFPFLVENRLYEALENVRKRAVPKIDDIARKLNRPLRIATFASAATTILLTSLVYSM